MRTRPTGFSQRRGLPVLAIRNETLRPAPSDDFSEHAPASTTRGAQWSCTSIPLTGVSELTVAAYEDEIELRKSARRPSHLIGCVVDAVTELDNAVDDLMN